MISKKHFDVEAKKIINFILETIESNDFAGDIDIDLSEDLLNITTQYGTFVLSKQSSLKEIWLSSPVSGPYHFFYDGKSWKSKSGKELFAILSKDLKMKISYLSSF